MGKILSFKIQKLGINYLIKNILLIKYIKVTIIQFIVTDAYLKVITSHIIKLIDHRLFYRSQIKSIISYNYLLVTDFQMNWSQINFQ